MDALLNPPKAAQSPRETQKSFKTPDPFIWNRVGIFAAIQSAGEIGLGSLLHSLHIPLAGHIMANLQGLALAAFLNRKPAHKKHVFFVSATSGALKSLSPSGKRFRPMFAIFTQGMLYHAAVNIFGVGAIGLMLGQALIGAWTSFQPFFFQYLFFGSDIVKSYEALFAFVARAMPYTAGRLSPLSILGWWIGLHAALSAFVGLLAWQKILDLSTQHVHTAGMTIKVAPKIPSWSQSARQSFKELGRPYFLWPFLFVLLFDWLGRTQWDHLAFIAARAVLAAFVCILAVKRIDFLKLAHWLRQKGWDGPAQALDTALQELTRNSQPNRHPGENRGPGLDSGLHRDKRGLRRNDETKRE